MLINKRIINALVLLLLVTGTIAQNVYTDNSSRIGKLKNGMTYYIRHGAKEKGVVDSYIAQHVGSTLEEPDQRGLAHLLKHMAFNGSKNFKDTPPLPSIVHWCEAHGIKFGTSLNVYTSVDETVYNVSLVSVKQESTIDSILLILYDWSHYLDLENKEIDKERGVIHEEWRARRAGTASQHLMKEALPIVYRGMKYEDCLPIGKMEIVDNFPYKAFRDYYHKRYRSNLQAIIVVGDINVDKIKKKIQPVFSAIPMPENAAHREYFSVSNNDKIVVASLKDLGQSITFVTFYMRHRATPDAEKSTVKYQRDEYVDDLAFYIIGEYLNEMQDENPKPCLSASVRLGQFSISCTKDASALSFSARQEDVKGSLDVTVGTIEQIRQYGFTPSELTRAKAFRQEVVDRQYNERNGRHNAYYVRRVKQNFPDNESITTEAYDKQLGGQFFNEVALDEVNVAMRETIMNKNQVLVICSSDKAGVNIPSDAQFEQMVLDVQAKTYPKYVGKRLDDRLIEILPKKGCIKSEKAGLHGIIEITLSNGIRVYFEKADYQKDAVIPNFFAEGGSSLYPAKDLTNTQFVSAAVKKGGVGCFSATEFNKFLAGRTVRINAGASNEAQFISGSSSIKDIHILFKLTYSYPTNLHRDDQVLQSGVNRMRSFLTNREASPNVSYNDSIVAIAYGNSPRVQPLKAASLDKVSYDRVLEIYKERFSNASNFKMTVMGSIDIVQLHSLLEQYIASLSLTGKKETFAKTCPDVRNCNETYRFEERMKTPLTRVTVFYTWDELYTAKFGLESGIFKRVLSTPYIDFVREERSGVYGVKLQQSLSKSSNPHAMLKIVFDTGPEKYNMVMPTITRQIEHIANKGSEAVGLQKVKEYLLKQYDQSSVTSDYWLYVIYNHLYHGVDFDKNYKAIVHNITASDTQRITHNLINNNCRIEVTMQSEKGM